MISPLKNLREVQKGGGGDKTEKTSAKERIKKELASSSQAGGAQKTQTASQVSISSTARVLSRSLQLARRQESQAPVRPSKVEMAKQRIQSGHYKSRQKEVHKQMAGNIVNELR